MHPSRKQETSTTVTQTADYIPMRIVEVEIGRPLPNLSAIDEKTERRYQRVSCLVRLHTQPLGTVELKLADNDVRPRTYASEIWSALSGQINEHLRQDGLPAVTGLDETGISCPS